MPIRTRTQRLTQEALGSPTSPMPSARIVFMSVLAIAVIALAAISLPIESDRDSVSASNVARAGWVGGMQRLS